MNKRILITGSAGFAGSHLVEHILENTDWDIVGLDSFAHRGDSERIPAAHRDRYKIYAMDLSTPVSKRLADKVGYADFIVNMAAESHVDRSITDPVPFVQNNVNLALHMLEYARLVKPQKFIQISTDEVYGPALNHTWHEEWSEILPSNPYAASKASQEAIAIAYWRTYGVPLIITNTMNMFGERQDVEKFVPMLISKIQKGQTVTIHGSENNIGSRHYLHARNHADALVHLLQTQPIEFYRDSRNVTIKPLRFNVVGEVEIDNLDMARRVAGILDKELKYDLVDFHHARPGHDRRYALDGSLIKTTGWEQPIDFETSLERTVHWALGNPEWLK